MNVTKGGVQRSRGLRALLGVAVFATALQLSAANRPGAATAASVAPETALQRLAAISREPLEVRGTPGASSVFVTGSIPVASFTTAQSTEGRAAAFWRVHGGAFGVVDPSRQLRLRSQARDRRGVTHLRYDQRHNGLPVLGKQLILHLDERRVRVVNGDFVPGIRVPTTPRIAAEDATARALTAVSRGQARRSRSEPFLLVFVDRARSSHLAWHVTVPTDNPIGHWRVIVAADDGAILSRWNQIHGARDRLTHTNGNDPDCSDFLGPPACVLPGTLRRAEGAAAVGDPVVDDTHDHTGSVYDFYSTRFGRASYDDAGHPLRSTVHFGADFDNAFWCPDDCAADFGSLPDGEQMVYGDGSWDGASGTFSPLGRDADVVAHELTHAVTEYTAGLIYVHESGALNESMSDVMAAVHDSDGDEWLIGEGSYTPAVAGDALRNMADPADEGQPGHMSDYVHTIYDSQGVHINSGIANRAAYLMATAPGYGIGRAEMGEIYYHALSAYLFPSSTFLDSLNALAQAAVDLHPSDPAYERAVFRAHAAVGLVNPPMVVFPNGGEALAGGAATTIEWEPNGDAGLPFRVETIRRLAPVEAVHDFESPGLPAEFASSGDAPWIVDAARSSSGARALRAGDVGDYGRSRLTLTKRLAEPGVLEFDFWVDSELNFDFFGFYVDGALERYASGSSSSTGWTTVSVPLSEGVHTFDWVYEKDNIISRGADTVWIDRLSLTGVENAVVTTLNASTAPGATTQPWTPPTDASSDNRVRVAHVGDVAPWLASDDSDATFSVLPPGMPALAIDDVQLLEGNAGVTDAAFTLSLSQAATAPVTVEYATREGTACCDEVPDFVAASGTIRFDAGETTKTLVVEVNGDNQPETHEDLYVDLVGVTGAVASDLAGRLLILNDDGDCTFDAAAKTVSLPLLASQRTLYVDDGWILYDEVSCGVANVLNTDTIAVSGGAGDDSLVIDLSEPLAPGATPEAAGPEIELNVNLGGGSNQVWVNGTTADDAIDIGSAGINLNPLEEAGNEDVDVSLAGVAEIQVSGNGGNDAISGAGRPPGLAATVGGPATIPLVLSGHGGDDSLTGGAGADVLSGGEGDDALTGGGGADRVEYYDSPTGIAGVLGVGVTGDGNDTLDGIENLVGSPHDDAVTGDGAANRIEGGEGNDHLVGGLGDDELDGGDGTDTVDFSGSETGVDVSLPHGTSFGEGDDTLTGLERVLGSAEDDVLEGDDGDNALRGNAGADYLIGGAGFDTVDYSTSPVGVTADLGAGTESVQGDTIDASVEAVLGSPHADVLIGSDRNDRLDGGAGVDSYSGLGADDTILARDGLAEPEIACGAGDDSVQADSVGIDEPAEDCETIDATPLPSIAIGDVVVPEGGGEARFQVTLAAPHAQELTAEYVTDDGSATSPADYAGGSGVVTIPPGETTAEIAVPISQDALDEANETFRVELSKYMPLGDDSGTATIVDDDAEPSVAVASSGSSEEGSPARFTVTLSAQSGRDVTVQLATVDGTAAAPGDYTAHTETLTFLAGESSKTIDVETVEDAIDEPDETFTAVVSAPVNAVLGTSVATGLIRNDDDPAVGFGHDAAAPEEGQPAMFTVELTRPSFEPVGVRLRTTPGSAGAGDFAETDRTLLIPAGETSIDVAVTTTEDTVDEENETFAVGLSAPSNAALGDDSGSATIVDDDAPPTVSLGPGPVVTEGGTAVFEVSLSAASERQVRVFASTAAGTATAADFVPLTDQAVTFVPGDTLESVSVTTAQDSLDEPSETFTLTLAAPANAMLGASSATATITDDDDGDPRLVATVGTGDAFVITLTHADGTPVTTLAPGRYDITVDDNSSFHNFHLRRGGATIDRTDVAFVGRETWNDVELTAGSYTYECEPHAGHMFGTFTVGHRPVAADDGYSIAEDGTLAVGAASGVLANDSDADFQLLTAVLDANVATGSLTLNPNGSFSYSPPANFNGNVSFTYRASDGALTSEVATVTIAVSPVNDAPAAQAQSVTTAEDTAKAVTLSATDIDSAALTYTVVAQPTKGVLSGTPPNLTYTPNQNATGADSLRFKANDGAVDSNEATVSISITPVNDAPDAVNDSALTGKNASKDVAVLANDVDVDGDALTVVALTQPLHGSSSINANGSVRYVPDTGYSGPDAFTYTVRDPSGAEDSANVSITVSTGSAPDAQPDAYAIAEDGMLVVSAASGVLANDSDGDGDPLTAELESDVTTGVLDLEPDGEFSYSPPANYSGNVSFTYRASDGMLTSALTTVTIAVDPVNDAPAAQAQSVTTAEDTAKAVTLSATDVDSAALTYTVVAQPTKGVLSGTPPNLTYTPNPDANGADSLRFKASDGSADSNEATVSISITPVNDAPVAHAQSVATAEDTQRAVTLSATDVEGSPLTYVVVGQPAHGTLHGTPPSLTYVPHADYNGPDAFTFKANDGSADSDVAQVSITVTPVDDPVPPQPPPPADTTAPTDPVLRSTSHRVGFASRDRTVDVSWSGAVDDMSGVDGFSFVWDNQPGTLPDLVKDAEETVTGTTSPALANGRWYVHLRTRDNAGNWSGTRHLGPFVISVPRPAKKTPKVTVCFRKKTVKIPKTQLAKYKKRGAKVGACKKPKKRRK